MLSNSPDTAPVRSVRHYDIAEAVINIDRGGLKPQLRSDRRLIGVSVADATTSLFCPTGLLTSEELELIDVPANSLLVDQLLPDRPVAPGDKWQHADTLLAPLFNLDAISKSDLSSELKEIDGAAARIELSGTIQGAIGGVSTDLDVKGRYKFDLASGRITWVALLVKEVRSIGHVGPGADLVARFEREGWILTRSYNDEIGASWAEAFGTDERSEVEAYCKSNGIAFEWTDDDGLTTRQRRSAILTHPVTGKRSWFNQVAFLNSWTLAEEVREYLVEEYGIDGLPFNTRFGNGDEIDADVVATINEVYEAHTLREPWQSGDLLLVDNIACSHGRDPYTGDREVLAALADPISVTDCAPTVEVTL